MFVNTDVANKFKSKILLVDPDYLCVVSASINIIFTLQSPVTTPAIYHQQISGHQKHHNMPINYDFPRTVSRVIPCTASRTFAPVFAGRS